MKKGSTLFLKVVTTMISTPVLALSIFVLPKIAVTAIVKLQTGSELAYIVLGLLLIMYLSSIPFYFALYQAIQLLRYIDQSQAFSMLSVIALKKIKNCALMISGLYVIALPLIFVVAQWDDAPGLVAIGMVILGASLVVVVFAAVLQRLLEEAIQIKSENDLTI
ncbi:DUF2975 domain-containing protein [Pisciglobus halotolerans]|uniref:DUF2975 domain-containing protein n=1 Tax=Pisciglobus halotolerans TaxID=745365 RepID=A0A1I3AWH1_9LACT|nr:Protein of unknown function [Pisciglobus halotolerans]